MSDRVYMADVAKYQDPTKIPWAVFVENGVLMGICKSSMGGGFDKNCDGHVAAMKDGGAKTGLYHWVDPTQDWFQQAIYFLRKIEQHEPDAIAYDIEQWWANWQLWSEYNQGLRPGSDVPRIPVSQWIDCINTFREVMRAETDYEQNARALDYSARWVLQLYPDLIPHVKDLQQWMAYYVLSGTPRKVTWEQLHTIPADGARPGLPPGIDEELWWQFSSLLILPGVNFRLDTNIFNGTRDQFFTWISNGAGGPPPRPDPEPEPLPVLTPNECIVKAIDELLAGVPWHDALTNLKGCLEVAEEPASTSLFTAVVHASTLNVRSGPGTEYPAISSLVYGDRVEIWEEVGTWGRLSPGGNSDRWASTKWMTTEA